MSSNTSKNMVTPSVTTGQQAFEWRTQLASRNQNTITTDLFRDVPEYSQIVTPPSCEHR
jgi:hypothetical protein